MKPGRIGPARLRSGPMPDAHARPIIGPILSRHGLEEVAHGNERRASDRPLRSRACPAKRGVLCWIGRGSATEDGTDTSMDVG
jgi:hypothetical protein